MSMNRDDYGRVNERAAATILPVGGQGEVLVIGAEPDGQPSLHVKVLERTAIVRFVDAEILFEEATVKALGDQLARLIEVDGYTRLLLNFSGVRYLSGAMLGRLDCLQQNLVPARGSIQLCGMEQLLRDVLRIKHLDRAFDVFADEAEALGLARSDRDACC
jgi:anti-anti-sigma regulatory factor